MNRTRRAIVLGAFVMLVLGADWALERAFSNYHLQDDPRQDGAAICESAPPSDAVSSPLAGEPADMPAAADFS